MVSSTFCGDEYLLCPGVVEECNVQGDFLVTAALAVGPYIDVFLFDGYPYDRRGFGVSVFQLLQGCGPYEGGQYHGYRYQKNRPHSARNRPCPSLFLFRSFVNDIGYGACPVYLMGSGRTANPPGS